MHSPYHGVGYRVGDAFGSSYPLSFEFILRTDGGDNDDSDGDKNNTYTDVNLRAVLRQIFFVCFYFF